MTNSNKKHEKLKQTILGQGGGWGKGKKKTLKYCQSHMSTKEYFVNDMVYCVYSVNNLC